MSLVQEWTFDQIAEMYHSRVLNRLDEAWEPARRRGVMGSVSLRELWGHASGFILESWRTLSQGNFVDCGTGAGVPGILLAIQLPATNWTLVDASEHRCQLAEDAVVAAGLRDRIRVLHSRLENVARRPELRENCEGVVARCFGPASELAECGLPLLKCGGSLVVSVSATTRLEWAASGLAAATGCKVHDSWSATYGGYLAVERSAPGPAELPRRQAARRRRPLLSRP